LGIRILLADDHKIIRRELTSFLNKQPEIEVIGEAEDGLAAIELTQELQPDIIITDISMPRLNGIEAAYEINRQNPHIKIITFSGHNNLSFVTESLQAGASAYVLKDSLLDELLNAIRAVLKNKIYLCSKIAGVIVSNYIKFLSASNIAILDTLSNTEKNLLDLIAAGNSDKHIEMEYQANIASIEADINSIKSKLNIASANELVKIAISRK